MNYEENIKIDENALEVEWLGQAELMFKYARLQADYDRTADQAKAKLDVVKSEIDKEVRTHPKDFDLPEKLTEAVINGAIIQDKRYKEAHEEYLDARYEADIMKGAVRAIAHRRDALENLVRLYGQNYFAGPTVPRDISEEVQRKHRENIGDQKQKNSNSKVKFKRKNS